MKTPFLKAVLATAAISSFALAAPEALAQTAQTPQQVEMGKALEQGPAAVRRYIFRTRMIYALTWADFYKAE